MIASAALIGGFHPGAYWSSPFLNGLLALETARGRSLALRSRRSHSLSPGATGAIKPSQTTRSAAHTTRAKPSRAQQKGRVANRKEAVKLALT